MNWPFSDRVDGKRRKKLLEASKFEEIADLIIEEMVVSQFCTGHGKISEVKGCKRAQFRLKVPEYIFDLFFNSPTGYRGNYLDGEKKGEEGNRLIINKMADKLAKFANETPDKKMTDCEITKSLSADSAKIWIDEGGVRRQNPITCLEADLLVEPWYGAAVKYLKHPNDCRDPNGCIKALDGVKAPLGTILTVKGGFIDQSGHEHVPCDKINRSQQINLYGFT